MKPPRELPVPPAAFQDDHAIELVRVWAANNRQHITLAPEIWPDPAAWGILLVDLARHVANALSARGNDAQEVLERIKTGFDAEWNFPTN